MVSNDLPCETRELIDMITHRVEIEAEQTKRRQCTTFGYNRGGVPIMTLWMGLVICASAFTLIGLGAAAANTNTSVWNSPILWLVVLTPFVVVPMIPFLFLKLRYALRAMGISIAIFVILAVIGDFMNEVMVAVLL